MESGTFLILVGLYRTRECHWYCHVKGCINTSSSDSLSESTAHCRRTPAPPPPPPIEESESESESESDPDPPDSCAQNLDAIFSVDGENRGVREGGEGGRAEGVRSLLCLQVNRRAIATRKH